MIIFYSPSYDGEGGRRCQHLMSLVKMVKSFTHVFVTVGDNNAKTVPIQNICKKFVEFRDSVAPTVVRFAGNMRRKDLPQELVSKKNMFMRNNLGSRLKSTKVIRREDFSDASGFHFDKFGEGYRHMASMIYSVFREFSETC